MLVLYKYINMIQSFYIKINITGISRLKFAKSYEYFKEKTCAVKK